MKDPHPIKPVGSSRSTWPDWRHWTHASLVRRPFGLIQVREVQWRCGECHCRMCSGLQSSDTFSKWNFYFDERSVYPSALSVSNSVSAALTANCVSGVRDWVRARANQYWDNCLQIIAHSSGLSEHKSLFWALNQVLYCLSYSSFLSSRFSSIYVPRGLTLKRIDCFFICGVIPESFLWAINQKITIDRQSNWFLRSKSLRFNTLSQFSTYLRRE